MIGDKANAAKLRAAATQKEIEDEVKRTFVSTKDSRRVARGSVRNKTYTTKVTGRVGAMPRLYHN